MNTFKTVFIAMLLLSSLKLQAHGDGGGSSNLCNGKMVIDYSDEYSGYDCSIAIHENEDKTTYSFKDIFSDKSAKWEREYIYFGYQTLSGTELNLYASVSCGMDNKPESRKVTIGAYTKGTSTSLRFNSEWQLRPELNINQGLIVATFDIDQLAKAQIFCRLK